MLVMDAVAANPSSEAHYQEQRRKAFFADVLAVAARHRNDLLSYEEARKALRAIQQMPATTETIPVEKIVGSVGRYRDFTRSFLPRSSASASRWKRLDAALERLESIPPVEVYQLGDVYFVRDGNHRVSVARANGVGYIEARVTRVATRVPLTAEAFEQLDDTDQMEIIREYAAFLDQTNLDELRPQQRIWFSTRGHYRVLLEHIAVHRYFMGLDLKREVPYEEAVAHWYDSLYEPIVAAIRRDNILADFPGRTEADLYLWIIDHQYYLSERYGPTIGPDDAADDFMERFGGPPVLRAVRALWERVRRATVGLPRAIRRAIRRRGDAPGGP
ncbi:MAG: DUF4032 domain-containing protein [Anaerolineae bacterium]|nr:DUF4032 domain-containing protein [Anaerolineae bacterium]